MLQLDATECVLTGGRKCVIFQLIDDHSRYAVASHVAWGETVKDAIVVFGKAVTAHGVPQRLLSDIRKVSSVGTIHVDKMFYKIDVDHAFQQVLVITTATRSSPPTCKARSSPSTPDPLLASPTSATADGPGPAQRIHKCHRSPDTSRVTDVLMRELSPMS
jgi:hypothetical protein